MTAPPRDIDCHEAVERLYEYLDKELTPEVRAAIEHHLKACAGCFRHFGFERAFLRFLEARSRERGAGSDLKRKIVQELFGSEAS